MLWIYRKHYQAAQRAWEECGCYDNAIARDVAWAAYCDHSKEQTKQLLNRLGF